MTKSSSFHLLYIKSVLLLASLAGISACGSVASTPAAQEVEVTGRGKTEEEARSNARQSALDKVVGALIDAETRITKDRLVEEVVSASAGYIDVFDTLETGKARDGSFYVRARVVVRANQLKQRLVEQQIVASAVDGESVVAKELSRARNAEAAARYIAKNFASFPLETMRVDLVGALEVLDKQNSRWVAGIKVRVTIDDAGWSRSVNVLHDALGVIASRSWTTRLEWQSGTVGNFAYVEPVSGAPWIDVGRALPDDVFRDQSFGSILRPLAGPLAGTAPKPLRWDGARIDGLPRDHCVVMIPEGLGWRSTIKAYVVPQLILREFARAAARDVRLEVTLEDSAGKAIRSYSVDMNVGPTAVQGTSTTCFDESAWPPHPSDARWIDIGSGAARRAPLEQSQVHFGLPIANAQSSGCVAYLPQGMPLGQGVFTHAFIIRMAVEAAPGDLEKTTAVSLKFRMDDGASSHLPDRRRSRDL